MIMNIMADEAEIGATIIVRSILYIDENVAVLPPGIQANEARDDDLMDAIEIAVLGSDVYTVSEPGTLNALKAVLDNMKSHVYWGKDPSERTWVAIGQATHVNTAHVSTYWIAPSPEPDILEDGETIEEAQERLAKSKLLSITFNDGQIARIIGEEWEFAEFIAVVSRG